jgi:DNA polymerase-3 subunit delta
MADVDAFGAARRAIDSGALSPVYHLVGDEELLKDDLVTAIVDRAVDPSTRDFNVDVRQAADLDGESLHALVETPPMLAETRVVVVKHIDQWRKNAKVWQVLDRYLDQPSPTTTLVLTEIARKKGGNPLQAALARRAQQVECTTLGPADLRAWVADRASTLDVVLEPDAVEHLIAVTQGQLGALVSELHKLAAAAEGPLTVDDVGVFVGVHRGETPEDWIDAVLARDVTRSIGMLDRVLALPGASAVRLVAVLGGHLIGLRLAVMVGRRRNAISVLTRECRTARLWALGPPDAVARRWAAAAPHWSLAALDRAVRASYDADRHLKSTRASTDAGVLTDLVLACARERDAA